MSIPKKLLLRNAWISSDNPWVASAIDRLGDIIKDESHLLDVQYTHDVFKFDYKLNYKEAGKKFKGDIKKVEAWIKNAENNAFLNDLRLNKIQWIDVPDTDSFLERKDLFFLPSSLEKGVIYENGILIKFDLGISQWQIEDYIISCLVREIQKFRQQEGLTLEDRVGITILGFPEFIKAIKTHDFNQSVTQSLIRGKNREFVRFFPFPVYDHDYDYVPPIIDLEYKTVIEGLNGYEDQTFTVLIQKLGKHQPKDSQNLQSYSTDFGFLDPNQVDMFLQERMKIVQTICSMIAAFRDHAPMSFLETV